MMNTYKVTIEFVAEKNPDESEQDFGDWADSIARFVDQRVGTLLLTTPVARIEKEDIE
jgi:hypothetical protein